MTLPILIDCDEVLSDFVGECLRVAAESGYGGTLDQITGWDIGKCLGWKGFDAAITNRVDTAELCYRMPEVPGGIGWLRAVEAEFGAARVFICTSPWNASWAAQRIAWLEKRGVPLKRQIHTSQKALIPGLLIDDAQHHIEAREPGQGFLIAQNWNRRLPDVPRGDHYAAMAWLREVA